MIAGLQPTASAAREAALLMRLATARTCLVVGTAGCVWDDIAAAGPTDAVLAVSRMGVDFPGRLDGWVKWGLADDLDAWGAPPERLEICLIGYECEHLTEGDVSLHATHYAVLAGVPRIILAGVPLLAEVGHYYPRSTPKLGLDHSRYGWAKYAAGHPEVCARIRSCSGWTRDFFGAPSAEWLAGA